MGNDRAPGPVVPSEPERSNTLVSTTTTDRATLSASDRCDRCGARAYVRVVLPGGGDLLFCRHHARVHEPQLRSVAVEYVDESAGLISD